jgi:C_GCAxxG_C_C family probable redox protein
MKSVEDGVAFSAKCWSDGYNCAESTLRGVCFAREVPLTDTAKRMATPFGGGIGRSEDLCGALTGGVLGIGAALGRLTLADDKLTSYDSAKRFYDSFRERFGAVRCCDLNKGDFKSQEHRERCGEFVREATRYALESMTRH